MSATLASPSTEATTTAFAPDLADPALFHGDRHLATFARLRRDDPVHLAEHPRHGRYWNLTRYDDVLQADLDHAAFASRDTFLLEDVDPRFTLPMFLAMEAPKHTAYRDAVKGYFTADSLARLEPVIRAHAREILDALPRGCEFDWVERVAIELTSRILATMFDFPLAQRHELIRWSDLATLDGGGATPLPWEQRQAGLMECLQRFSALRATRTAAPGHDLLSALVHGPAAAYLKPSELLGNVLMLIVAGNDTTRNSISGGVVALNRHPDQYALLRAQPQRLPAAVAEMFRWQTPIAYMRRVATRDCELHGRRIRAGDKVVLWYVSGNRDEAVFADADRFNLERDNLKRSLSFGFGIHRCLGARLSELQLRVLWQEILPRFVVEQCGDAQPVASTFIKGWATLPVRLRDVA